MTPKVYRVRFEECEHQSGDVYGVVGTQEVSGAPETVAAFLRALADQINPPLRPTRPPHRGMAAPGPFEVTEDGLRVLGKPTL